SFTPPKTPVPLSCEFHLNLDRPYNSIGLAFSQALQPTARLLPDQGARGRMRQHEPRGATDPGFDLGALRLGNQLSKFLAGGSISCKHHHRNAKTASEHDDGTDFSR